MKRVSTRGIVFIDDAIALMYRKKNGQQYYTLPGGGLEDDELLTDGVAREIFEEFGINAKAKKLSYVYSDENSIAYYFLCDYVNGNFGSGQGEEYLPERNSGFYEPRLIKIEDIKNISLKPDKLKEILIEDILAYNKSLSDCIKFFN